MNTINSLHISVLLQPSIDALSIRENGIYIDATFGRGGHSRAILSALGAGGKLYAFDRDFDAAKEAATIQDSRFHFIRAPFSEMKNQLPDLVGKIDGVLFDLGVSSPQLDEAERGFSFQKAGPLDMRMDAHSGQSAADFLAQCDEKTLAKIIRDYGGETHSIAARLARAICAAKGKLITTLDLAEVVSDAMPKKFHKPHYHPATQTFQAIRIAVNDEVGEIERGLAGATELLTSGGVLAAITFHSLEDSLVKRFIRAHEGADLPAEIPTRSGKTGQVLRLISPVIKPSTEEIAANPRARSARLRKAIKI